MDTKYVIIMHNAEGHSFEESPLLDSYPKPELIEHYLNKGIFSFAKVEKRYSLGNFEKAHTALNTKREFYEVYFIREDGSEDFFGTENQRVFERFISYLEYLESPYKIGGKMNGSSN